MENGPLEARRQRRQPDADSGDIITVDTFNDFDLRFEWIVAPGGNSGMKYLVTEERDEPIAHEYQIIDDVKHPDALIGPHRATAALYDVIAAPANKILKAAGLRNEGRILVNGNHVEHWLNGAKVLEYELGSAALKAAKAKSKFKDVTGWEDKLKGHILLQDHGDEVAYQNIRIRELNAPSTRAPRQADARSLRTGRRRRPPRRGLCVVGWDVTSLAPPARRAYRPSTRSFRGSGSSR